MKIITRLTTFLCFHKLENYCNLSCGTITLNKFTLKVIKFIEVECLNSCLEERWRQQRKCSDLELRTGCLKESITWTQIQILTKCHLQRFSLLVHKNGLESTFLMNTLFQYQLARLEQIIQFSSMEPQKNAILSHFWILNCLTIWVKISIN